MDIELARQVIRTAFSSSAQLQTLLPVLKQRCTAEEYQSYALSIAAAVDTIGSGLTNKAIAAHPGLATEIESSIAQRGHFS
ncbi:MAG: hypothetical protein E6G97_20645 [Alphaproteobacteria bacterium]|nr:MAG: hypothetical protein E6G97_20645 [Alphaproteobacteria bacterium]